jgi:hypothetical protein
MYPHHRDRRWRRWGLLYVVGVLALAAIGLTVQAAVNPGPREPQALRPTAVGFGMAGGRLGPAHRRPGAPGTAGQGPAPEQSRTYSPPSAEPPAGPESPTFVNPEDTQAFDGLPGEEGF